MKKRKSIHLKHMNEVHEAHEFKKNSFLNI
jgi:hypothetical protein